MKKKTSVEKEQKTEAKTTDVFICSTLTGDNAFTIYHKTNKETNDIPRRKRQILIKGKANVINAILVTPHGVVTKITSEELKQVEENCPAWKRQVDGGFIKVLKYDPSVKDTDKIGDDMKKDSSRQPTPADLKKARDQAAKDKEKGIK